MPSCYAGHAITTLPDMPNTEPVAKIRIVVQRDGDLWCLMSRKRKRDTTSSDHDKLEMPGGHLDGDESPREALLRECEEEEATGSLAELVAQREPVFATETVDGAVHHLFELALSEREAEGLVPEPTESLGFRLVRVDRLTAGELDDELTYRTRLILEAFGPPHATGK